MIRTSISDAKNRLSHYIRLVRGGEEVEIMDRDTPVAKLVHISQSSDAGKKTSWVKEAMQLGMITERKDKSGLPHDFLDLSKMPGGEGVMQALLEEREEGR